MPLLEKIRVWINRTWNAVRRAITDEQLQRYRLWIFKAYVVIILVIFSILALFASSTDYFAFDLEITRELQREIPSWAGGILTAISWFGYATQSIITVSVAVIILSILGLRWEAVSATFAGVFAGGLNYLIKIAIRRPRPSADLIDVIEVLKSYSFPSGHVMFYTTFFGFLLFLTFILLKYSFQRSILLILLAALVFTVGFSRLYLGEHWPSDVVGGYMMGSLTLILTIKFYRWGKTGRTRDQIITPPDENPQDSA